MSTLTNQHSDFIQFILGQDMTGRICSCCCYCDVKKKTSSFNRDYKGRNNGCEDNLFGVNPTIKLTIGFQDVLNENRSSTSASYLPIDVIRFHIL